MLCGVTGNIPDFDSGVSSSNLDRVIWPSLNLIFSFWFLIGRLLNLDYIY